MMQKSHQAEALGSIWTVANCRQLEIANALRTLRRTHEAIIEHDELLSAFEDADEATWEGLVAQFRPEMTQQVCSL